MIERAEPAARTKALEPPCPANFYALPFASQMIVWAMRRRFEALGSPRARPDEEVLQVFHMADWGALYTALLTVVDILEHAPRTLLHHAVSCPCLAPHEAHVLNSLTHLQRRCRDEALLSLCELLEPARVRLALPQLASIVRDVDDQGLRFVYVDLSAMSKRAGKGAHGSRQPH